MESSGRTTTMRVYESEKFSGNGIFSDFDGHPYYIVDTDYDNYAVVWRCKPKFLEQNKHIRK